MQRTQTGDAARRLRVKTVAVAGRIIFRGRSADMAGDGATDEKPAKAPARTRTFTNGRTSCTRSSG
jgi:hypothetical protein